MQDTYKTLMVTTKLAQMVRNLPHNEVNEAVDCLEKNIEEYLEQASPTLLGLVSTMVWMDRSQKESPNKHVCTKGCNHCCHIPVVVSDKEALLLAWLCQIKENSISEEDVEFLSTQAQAHQEGKFLELSEEQRRCILLDSNGCCTMYDFRPLMCRAHFAAKNPENCRVDGPEQGIQEYSAHYMSEVFCSGASMLFGGNHLLAAGLLKYQGFDFSSLGEELSEVEGLVNE